jgi:hypothetical protein
MTWKMTFFLCSTYLFVFNLSESPPFSFFIEVSRYKRILFLLLFALAGFVESYAQAPAFNTGKPFRNGVSAVSGRTALHFDGTDDSITTPDIPEFRLSQSYSLELWFRADALTPGAGLIVRNQHPDSAGFSLRLSQLSGTGLDFDGLTTDENLLVANHWYHIAAIKDGDERQLFVNGQEIALNGTATAVEGALGTVSIGASGNVFFYGAIDELRVWNRPLSESELEDNLDVSPDASSAGLVLYFDMEDGTAEGDNTALSSLFDRSIYEAHSTLTGFSLTGTSSNFSGSLAMLRPEDLEITSRTTDSIGLTWNKPALADASHFLVEVSKNAAFTELIPASPLAIAGTETELTVSGLSSGTRYWFTVFAVDSALAKGRSFPAGTISALTLAAPPAVMSSVPADGGTKAEITDSVVVTFDRPIFASAFSGISLAVDGGATVDGISRSIRDDSVLVVTYSGLSYSTTYKLTIPAGALANADSVKNSLFETTFTTAGKPPVAEHVTPANNAVSVALDALVTTTFDMAVTAVDLSGITIKDDQNQPVSGVIASLTDSTITIAHNDFAFETTYTVHIPEQAVEGSTEARNTGFSWSFKTLAAPPAVVLSVPADGGTGAGLTDSVVVTFDRPVFASAFGGISLAVDGSTDVPGITRKIKNDSVLVVTYSGLSYSTTYRLSIPEGALANADSVKNGLITVLFTTKSRQLLTRRISPADGSTGVALNAPVTITYSKPVVLSNLSGAKLMLPDGSALSGLSVSISADTLLQITHPDFSNAVTYTLEVAEGTVTSGDETNEAFSVAFRAIKTVPVVSEVTPVANATRVPAGFQVSATFSQIVSPLDLSKASITGEGVSGTTAMRLSDSTLVFEGISLVPEKQVTVTVPEGVVKNDDGLTNEPFSWSFTVRMAEPVVMKASPVQNETRAPISGPVRLSFSHALTVVNADSIELRNAGTNALVPVQAVVIDSTLTLRHQQLPGGKPFRLRMKPGAVMNGDSVKNTAYELFFTTVKDAPSMVSISPAPNALRVPIDANIVVKFDQPLILGDTTGLRIRSQSGSRAAISGISLVDSTLTIVHTGLLPGQRYIVNVPANAVRNDQDAGNNPVDGAFTTVKAAPEVSSVFPPDRSTGILLDAVIEFTYNQTVFLADTSRFALVSAAGDSVKGLRVRLVQGNRIQLSTPGLAFLTTYTLIAGPGAVKNTDSVASVGKQFQFTTIIQRPAIPALFSPLAADSLVPVLGRFSWDRPPRAVTFTWQLSDSPAFTTVLQERTMYSDTSAIPTEDLTPLTRYFWRVRALNDGGDSDWSEVRSFVVKTQAPAPVFPANRETGISIAPRFAWSVSPEGLAVRIQVSTDSLFATSLADTVTVPAFFTLRNMSANTVYFWRLRVNNPDGQSEWTPARRFTTRIDPAAAESGALNAAFAFGETSSVENRTAPKRSDFRLVVLPGRDSLAIDAVFTGATPKTWRAFLEPGNSQYVEFKKDDARFKFRPGRGFWVLSTETVTLNQVLQGVPVKANDTYGVKLQSGWNIIGTPYQRSVAWDLVQQLNGISGDLFLFDKTWRKTAALEPLQGYYYYNDPSAPRDSMFFPYADASKRGASPVAAPADEPILVVKARFDKNLTAETVWSLSETDKGSHLPTDGFESHAVQLKRDAAEGTRWYRMVTPTHAGEKPLLEVSATAGQSVALDFSFVNWPGETHLALEQLNTGVITRLNDKQITFTAQTQKTSFRIHAGSPAELEQLERNGIPSSLELKPNFPNPFNPRTVIRFGLPVATEVVLEVFDVQGRRVALLENRTLQAGWHAVPFNGATLSSGVYVYRLKAGNQLKTGKMTLLK